MKRNPSSIVDPETGRPRLLSKRCATCIFRPGNQMHLAPGRLRSLVNGALENDTWIPCHDTLAYGPHPDFGEAICRGFYDRFASASAGIRLAEALGGCPEVPPPTNPDQHTVRDLQRDVHRGRSHRSGLR